MKSLKPCLSLLVVVIVGTLLGCSVKSSRASYMTGSIRTSLDQAGLKDVSVDVDSGGVTLSGHVAASDDRSQAESIAKAVVGTLVVSNKIAIIPRGGEPGANNSSSDLDKRIEGNLDAGLIQGGLHQAITYAVKNQVVTMTGEVDSQSKRVQAQEIAASVPNVQQVVNELQVKDQKAASSN
jgi:osmotically-inducible protein OsmY